MKKSKIFKVVTASAIAASSVAAVAPNNADAASTSVSKTVDTAIKQMKKAQDTYLKTGTTKKIVSTATVQKEITKAKKAYNDAKKKVAKSGGKNKNAYLAKLSKAYKYVKNAEGYVKTVKYAANLNSQAKAIQTAVIKYDYKTVKATYPKFASELAKSDKKIKAGVYGGNVEKVLFSTYTNPAKTIADAVRAYNYANYAKYWIGKDKLTTAEQRIKIVDSLLAKVSKTTPLGQKVRAFVAQVKEDYKSAQNFDLTIMHTNDTHAHLDTIAKRITAIKQVRAASENSLLLDAGDVFTGTLYFNKYEGLADLEFMELIGYDAMTFGNHEFDKKTDTLAKFVKETDFPLLSANVDFSKDANMKGYFNDSITSSPKGGQVYNGMVKTIDGEKVGIFGLTTAETPSISSPGEGVVFEDYIAQAKKMVESFEKQGVNKIIALTHIGYDDGGGDNDVTLAKEVEGIDIIVGGHSHTKIDAPVLDTTGNEPTVIVSANEYSKFLGTVDVEFDPSGKIISQAGKLIELEAKDADGNFLLKDDPEAAQILETKYKPAVVEMQQQVVAKTDVDLNGERASVRTGETNLGNLITDGMLAKAKTINPDTVIALQNGGGIRASINKGNITLSDVLTVLPFGNALGIMELKGSEIRSGLEHGLALTPEQNGGFLHVAGMKFTYDSSLPAGSKLKTVEVKGKDGNFSALKDDESYYVATNIFTAKGGDGFEEFGKAAAEGRLVEAGFVDWEVFKEQLEALPDKTVNQQIEGRITDIAAK
ncbi:5'-nucleotidase C-terminal domain-containing protein [Bacillus massilinigeriensis]|uniref:5'-nucleotidase C-terminal domain-containing protein n=1 Tax=Bacillus massilionigeriensis TaxID=1805475 RepID=UPI00096B23BB|nr:5'-nucleotidase C-terminal domain-containing protein [Bacillus massilionigeriensis]